MVILSFVMLTVFGLEATAPQTRTSLKLMTQLYRKIDTPRQQMRRNPPPGMMIARSSALNFSKLVRYSCDTSSRQAGDTFRTSKRSPESTWKS